MDMTQGMLLIFVCFHVTSGLLIGNFPHTRVNSTILTLETQLHVFARIFGRYDIVAIPNIVSFALDEFFLLREEMRRQNSNYQLRISTTMIKPPYLNEHVAIIYRSDLLRVSDFVRDQPTGALCMAIHVFNTGQDFVLSIVHLDFENVQNELEGLPSAFDRLQAFFNLENILFTGDFNTFPTFLPKSQYNAATVTTNSSYQWFIQYSQNTFVPVVPSINGAAARFLARGDIRNWVVPDSMRIWDTMSFFNLTLSEAAGMGLFMPVEIELVEPIFRP